MNKYLKGKRILITAGPTWVAIDRVRVLTNIFSGGTGVAIAKYAYKMGASVTLLLGPGSAPLDKNFKNEIKVLNFRYFDELSGLIKKEAGSKKYDILIHSAAVSDYRPEKIVNAKIRSGQNNLTIRLKPAVKIVDQIKKYDPGIFLVKFKLEIEKPKRELVDIAYRSMLNSKADLIVANNLEVLRNTGVTLIINQCKKIFEVKNRRNLPIYLFKIINKNLKEM